MEIVPSIEIKNGQSLWPTFPRAAQPNLKVTDPLRIVARWKDEGAPRIHLLDVDGVRVGMPQNREVIRDLVRRAGLPVQICGGVANADVADRLYTMGVDRVVVPITSVQSAHLAEMFRRSPDKVVAEIKVLDGRWVAGPTPGSEIPIKAVVNQLQMIGMRRVMLCPVDKMDAHIPMPLEIATYLAALPHLKVSLRGNFAVPQDLSAYAAAGVESVVLGKALYDSKISLSGK
jgi:phosphoribosylformimino-5-aminoimidazole carboxamide ribotide isomerase